MLKNLRTRPVLLHLTAMAIILATSFAANPLVKPVRAEVDYFNALLVTSRDKLRICVDVSGKADATQVTQHLQMALAQARQHPDWVDAYGSSSGIPTLETCEVDLPAGRLGRFEPVGPGLTQTPGPYRTVLVVLDSEQAERTLGENNAMYTSYELMQLGNGHDDVEYDHGSIPESEGTVVPVTSALIVREDFLQDREFVDWYLTLAVGLNPEIKRRSPEEDSNATKPEYDELDFEAGDPNATE